MVPFWNRQNYRNRKQVSGFLGLVVGGAVYLKWLYEGIFLDDGNILYFDHSCDFMIIYLPKLIELYTQSVIFYYMQIKKWFKLSSLKKEL